MNWDAIGAISEVVGAIGVVLTMVYLAFEVRRNTRAILLDTGHDVTEEIRSIYALMAEHNDLADLVHRAATDADRIRGTEKVRWYALNMNFLRAMENARIQWIEKSLDSRQWSGFKRQTMDYTQLPGFRDFWANRQHWFSTDFQQFMENEILKAEKTVGVRMPGDY